MPQTISVIEQIASLALDDVELARCINENYEKISDFKKNTL